MPLDLVSHFVPWAILMVGPWVRGRSPSFLIRDPVGFSSVGAPMLVLGIAASAIPIRPVGLAFDLAALLWACTFVLGGSTVWRWWSRVVLRRPVPSPERQFELALIEAKKIYIDATWALPPGVPADPSRARIGLARTLALEPPTAEWRALRDRFARMMEVEMAWFESSGPTSGLGEAHHLELSRLADLQLRLRGQEVEWRGLYPIDPFARQDSPDRTGIR